MGLGYHTPGSGSNAEETEELLAVLTLIAERLAEIRDQQNSVVVLLDEPEPPQEP